MQGNVEGKGKVEGNLVGKVEGNLVGKEEGNLNGNLESKVEGNLEGNEVGFYVLMKRCEIIQHY